jgi:hypothetical protein
MLPRVPGAILFGGFAGDCDFAGLGRVSVLAVAAPLAEEVPAIGFDELDDVADLHRLILIAL